MRRAVIACEMLKDELTKAMKLAGSDLPIVWMDTKYHNNPSLLHEKLQEKIDGLEGYEEILLTYGACGNAVINLKATTARLVIPKTEDCISMILSRPGKTFIRLKNTYFLTRAWIDSDANLLKDFKRTVEKYGRKRAERLFKKMLHSYDKLMLIDTGAYNVGEYVAKAEEIAKLADMSLFVEKGSIWMLEKLISGPYEEFCVVPKGGVVTFDDLGFSSEKPAIIQKI